MTLLALPIAPADALGQIIVPSLATLPWSTIKRSGQARQRLPRPHHHRTCKEVAIMADANSMRVVARTKDRVALYDNPCPSCGKARLSAKRDLGTLCRRCAPVKKHTTHGLTDHRLYRVWSAAKDRCYRRNCKDFPRYGGRGIRMCAAWRTDASSFIRWAISHGASTGLDLDRIDVNGNYEPSNCRFITHAENCRNKSNNAISPEQAKQMKSLLAKGMPPLEASRRLGVSHSVARHISSGKAWVAK